LKFEDELNTHGPRGDLYHFEGDGADAKETSNLRKLRICQV